MGRMRIIPAAGGSRKVFQVLGEEGRESESTVNMGMKERHEVRGWAALGGSPNGQLGGGQFRGTEGTGNVSDIQK